MAYFTSYLFVFSSFVPIFDLKINPSHVLHYATNRVKNWLTTKNRVCESEKRNQKKE